MASIAGSGQVLIGNTAEGFITFDASEAETHRRDNEVTQFPVEKGANTSDHVRPLPTVVELLLIMSATPIPLAPGVIDPQRVSDARTKMIRWRDQGTMLDIVTLKEWYQSFVILGINEDSDANNANDFEASVVFQQLSTAELQYVQLPKPKSPIGDPKQAIGTQTNASTGDTSALAAMAGQ